MKTHSKSLKLVLLTALFAICACMGAFMLTGTKTASAASGSFHVVGASVRVSTYNPGIRFCFGIPESIADDDDYEIGTLVIPKTVLSSNTLDHNDDADGDGATINYRKIVCTKKWLTGSQLPANAKSGYRYFTAALRDLPTSQYNTVICARAYYYQWNMWPTTYYYSDVMEKTIGYVASAALNDGFSDVDNIVTNIVKAGFGNTSISMSSPHDFITSSESFSQSNSKGYLPVWSSSDTSVATVNKNGVVTVTGSGDVTISATIGNQVNSKSLFVRGPVGTGMTTKNFSVISKGWDVSDNAGWISKSANEDGDLTISARVRGDWDSAEVHSRNGLVLRNLPSQAYFERLITEGYSRFTFQLAVGGTSASYVDDLYILGHKLTDFPLSGGKYQCYINLQEIVDNYSTIGKIGTSYQASLDKFDQQFLSWYSDEKGDEAVFRRYTFTMEHLLYTATPTISISGSDPVTVNAGSTTTLTKTSNWSSSYVVWSSSNTAIATVSSSGVVTGVSAGSVTITANVGGVTASRKVYVKGTSGAIRNENIGLVLNGWNQTNASYITKSIDGSGNLVITTKFTFNNINTQYGGDSGKENGGRAGLVFRDNLSDKAFYEYMIAQGYTRMRFDIAVGGSSASKVSDLYVFGTRLTNFPKVDGKYRAYVNLQYIVDNYNNLTRLGTGIQAYYNAYFNLQFLAWNSDGSDGSTWSTVRNYVFTISDPVYAVTPTVSAISGNSSVVAGNTITLSTSTNWSTSDIVWTSSNTSVATVSSSGVVTGQSAGSVTITANVGGVTKTKSITVSAPTITITGSTSVVAGNTITLSATANNGAAIIWRSTDDELATVSSSGVVTGLLASYVDIYATTAYGGYASKTITVSAPTITITGGSTSMVVGDTMNLSATANNGASIIWSSNYTSRATVNSSGVVTAVGAGSVTITATTAYGGSATKTITVNAVSISISGSNSVTEGDTLQLSYSSNAGAPTWTSSNTSYATVSSSGLVTAKTGISSNQTVTITATVRNVQATKTITVNAATVSISGDSSTVAGTTISLTASTNATTGTVYWTTSGSSPVATVSSSGVVTTMRYGSVTITAQFRGAQATKLITVTRPFETSELAVRSGGTKYTSGTSYCTIGTGSGDQINASVCFVGNTSYYPQLMINPKAQSVYSGLNSAGYSYLTFDLVVEGSSSNKLSDIYIFGTGQAISSFTKVNGVYKIWLTTANLSYARTTMYNMFNNADPAGPTSSKSWMFISWRNTDSDNGVYRYYTFKMSNIRYSSSKS